MPAANPRGYDRGELDAQNRRALARGLRDRHGPELASLRVMLIHAAPPGPPEPMPSPVAPEPRIPSTEPKLPPLVDPPVEPRKEEPPDRDLPPGKAPFEEPQAPVPSREDPPAEPSEPGDPPLTIDDPPPTGQPPTIIA